MSFPQRPWVRCKELVEYLIAGLREVVVSWRKEVGLELRVSIESHTAEVDVQFLESSHVKFVHIKILDGRLKVMQEPTLLPVPTFFLSFVLWRHVS